MGGTAPSVTAPITPLVAPTGCGGDGAGRDELLGGTATVDADPGPRKDHVFGPDYNQAQESMAVPAALRRIALSPVLFQT